MSGLDEDVVSPVQPLKVPSPVGVAVSPNGSVLVADAANNTIQVFDAAGNFLFTFGSEGSDDGQFSFPKSVAVGPDGRIVVADEGNQRIQVFDAAGKFLFAFGSEGSGVSDEIRSRAKLIAIRTSPRVESLNVAVAAGILLYEVLRGR